MKQKKKKRKETLLEIYAHTSQKHALVSYSPFPLPHSSLLTPPPHFPLPSNPTFLPHSTQLIPIHSHPLRIPTELPIRGGADGPAALRGGALLEREQLLGAEALVVDLRRRLDEVLQVGAGEEVAQVGELAVALVLDWMEVVESVKDGGS